MGILLAFACAIVTQLGFLYKHKGANEAPTVDIRRPFCFRSQPASRVVRLRESARPARAGQSPATCRNFPRPWLFGPVAGWRKAVASRNGLPWSAEEVKRLREMAAQGMSAPQIAAALDRTNVGIKSKALALGIALARAHPPRSGTNPSATIR